MEQPLAETAVFVDTNLGTRFALSVPADITAGDLKRKLKYEHNTCFPNHGKIIVHSLMVKKKSIFYHIPNSMLIKEACEGFRSAWFLRIDASKLADISMQQDTIPSSMNHFRRGTSSNQGEINNSDFNKVPTSSNLISPSNSACCKPVDQFFSTKFTMDRKIEGSTSNSHRTSKIVCCTISSVMTINMRDQAGEIARDCSSCEEGKVDVLSSSTKRRKLAHNNQGNVMSKEAVVTRQIYKPIPGPGFDSGLEVIKGDIVMDEAPYANQKDITRLSAYPLEGGQNKNSFPMEEDPNVNLSEKISVSSLILRYFSDSDEANSKDMLHRNMIETEKSTLQMNNMLNIQKSLPTEETGCAAKNVKYLADSESAYEAQSDCDTACSFNNITPSEANQVSPMSNNTKNKDKPTASGDKRRPNTIGSKSKSNNAIAKFSTFQAYNSSSHRNKSQISSTQVNRKLVLFPPRLISSFSPQTPSKKSTKILSGSINKCEVGKRLVQAANKICSSFSVKKSSKSLNPWRGNMSAPDSVVMARRLCFEMVDSDD